MLPPGRTHTSRGFSVEALGNSGKPRHALPGSPTPFSSCIQPFRIFDPQVRSCLHQGISGYNFFKTTNVLLKQEKSEAQRGEVTCPKSHSYREADLPPNRPMDLYLPNKSTFQRAVLQLTAGKHTRIPQGHHLVGNSRLLLRQRGLKLSRLQGPGGKQK